MTNSCELKINELDTVAGGTGSLADVATYVNAYLQALGAEPVKVVTEAPQPPHRLR